MTSSLVSLPLSHSVVDPTLAGGVARLEVVVDRGEDTTSFHVDGEFVGWVEPMWDPSVYPCRIAGWLAIDERPQADGAPCAGLGVFRHRWIAEAAVRARIS